MILSHDLSDKGRIAVEITVGLSREDPLYVGKRAYLAKSGRDATSVRFPLQQSRYPSELVDFLRLLLVEADDIGMQVTFEEVTTYILRCFTGVAAYCIGLGEN